MAKFKCGTSKAALDDARNICKVSDGTRAAGKCLKNILISCFGSGCVLEWRNINVKLMR
jgi:hypothetical protein